jgi:hypothetical protein
MCDGNVTEDRTRRRLAHDPLVVLDHRLDRVLARPPLARRARLCAQRASTQPRIAGEGVIFVEDVDA